MREHFPELAGWKVFLLATDISQEMLHRSREGRYLHVEVSRGLSPGLIRKYFHHDGTDWQIDANIRSAVTFQQLNLADPWPSMPKMDLVMIRNVMIYLDVETRKSILGRLTRVLQPDGYLVLGGAETTINLDDSYQRVEELKGGFYRLRAK